jgi:hypothetical protein
VRSASPDRARMAEGPVSLERAMETRRQAVLVLFVALQSIFPRLRPSQRLRFGLLLVLLVQLQEGEEDSVSGLEFSIELLREADRLAGCAKKRLGKTWTLRRQGRLRNRYELKGTVRRQARTAHAVFKWSLLLRAILVDRDAGDPSRMTCTERLHPVGFRFVFVCAGTTTPDAIASRCCQVIDWSIRARFWSLRWPRAGWEAHYNAACCYALGMSVLSPGDQVRHMESLAFKHLQFAISQGGASIAAEYVAKLDPDLAALRPLRPWKDVLSSLYGRSEWR